MSQQAAKATPSKTTPVENPVGFLPTTNHDVPDTREQPTSLTAQDFINVHNGEGFYDPNDIDPYAPIVDEQPEEEPTGESEGGKAEDEPEEEVAETDETEEEGADETEVDEEPEAEAEGEDAEEDETEKPADDILNREVAIKVNGKGRQVKIADLVKDAQKYASAEEKFQAASKQAKDALTVAKSAKEDPLGTAFRLLQGEVGHKAAYETVLKQAVDLVAKHMEYESLSEQDRAVLDARRDAEAARQEAEDLRAQADAERRKVQGNALATSILDAARKAGVVKSQEAPTAEEIPLLLEIARIYDQGAESGSIQSVQEAVERFVESREKMLKAHLASLSPEDLAKLSPELVDKLSESQKQKRIEAVKNSRKSKKTGSSKPTKRKSPFFDSYEQALGLVD